VLLNYLSLESFFGCSYKHVLEFERASSKDFRRQKDFWDEDVNIETLHEEAGDDDQVKRKMFLRQQTPPPPKKTKKKTIAMSNALKKRHWRDLYYYAKSHSVMKPMKLRCS